MYLQGVDNDLQPDVDQKRRDGYKLTLLATYATKRRSGAIHL